MFTGIVEETGRVERVVPSISFHPIQLEFEAVRARTKNGR